MIFGTLLLGTLVSTWGLLWGFLPQFLLAALTLAVGGLLAFFLSRGVIWAFTQLQLNRGGVVIGLKEILERGTTYNLPGFLGWTVWWFIMVVAFLTALHIMGLSAVLAAFPVFGAYALHTVTAALILLVGITIANFLSGVLRASVRIARLASANVLANVVWLATLVAAVLIALRELQVPEQVIGTLVIATIAALALAAGLAFGTGRESARSWLGKLRRDLTE